MSHRTDAHGSGLRRNALSAVVAVAFLLPALLVLLVSARNATAMPMFTRKLGVPCGTCHTTIPRLNEAGYEFRAAGLRMPEMIGKPEEKQFELGDYFSGRIQARYDASRTRTGPAKQTRNQISFHEFTVYPVTGSWGRYFSSLTEFSLLPDEPIEVENAYVRINFGKAERYLQGRVGIFHPFEGYGASDRPLSLSRPFFQRTPSNFNQSTFFTPWGFDQAGLEVGYDRRRLSLRATLFNGLVLREEEGVLNAFAAQGGTLSKPASLPAHNTPDVQLFANLVLHPEGGGVSGYYYHGNLALPLNGIDAAAGFFRNDFDRVGVYGSYPVLRRLHLLTGFQHGREHPVTGEVFNSRGAFVEANVPLGDYFTPGIRYDWFDPATNRPENALRGLTGFVNVPLQNGLQFIAEYQRKKTERGLAAPRKEDTFQIRFIFIQ